MEPAQSLDPRGNRPPVHWVTQLFERYELPLLTYASRLLQGDPERARDIVQDAFAKLCQQTWPEIEPHATAWLYRTCRNSTDHPTNKLNSARMWRAFKPV